MTAGGAGIAAMPWVQPLPTPVGETQRERAGEGCTEPMLGAAAACVCPSDKTSRRAPSRRRFHQQHRGGALLNNDRRDRLLCGNGGLFTASTFFARDTDPPFPAAWNRAVVALATAVPALLPSCNKGSFGPKYGCQQSFPCPRELALENCMQYVRGRTGAGDADLPFLPFPFLQATGTHRSSPFLSTRCAPLRQAEPFDAHTRIRHVCNCRFGRIGNTQACHSRCSHICPYRRAHSDPFVVRAAQSSGQVRLWLSSSAAL